MKGLDRRSEYWLSIFDDGHSPSPRIEAYDFLGEIVDLRVGLESRHLLRRLRQHDDYSEENL